MKTRDCVFWTVLTFGSLLTGHWLRTHEPSAPHAVRPATAWDKLSYYWAIWTLAKHAPQQAPPDYRQLRQDMPDSVVNAAPERQLGPDGEPLLAHGEGW